VLRLRGALRRQHARHAAILLSGNLGAIERFVRPIAQSWDSDHPQLAALAATEPDRIGLHHGPSAGRLRTRVEKKDGGYRINGRKIFISNGSLASLVTVFASHDPTGPIRESVSCFASRPTPKASQSARSSRRWASARRPPRS